MAILTAIDHFGLSVLPVPPISGPDLPSALKDALLAGAAAMPVAQSFVPLIMLALTGSWEKALKMLSVPSLWASILTSSIWVYFTFIAVKAFDCQELVLSYTVLLTSSYMNLLIVCAHTGGKKMAAFSTALVLPTLGYAFYASRLHPSLSTSLQDAIGFTALVLLLAPHGCLLVDVYHAVGLLENLVLWISIVPVGILNAFTFYIITKERPDQKAIIYSALFGAILAALEVVFLAVLKCCYKRHQVFQRIQDAVSATR